MRQRPDRSATRAVAVERSRELRLGLLEKISLIKLQDDGVAAG